MKGRSTRIWCVVVILLSVLALANAQAPESSLGSVPQQSESPKLDSGEAEAEPIVPEDSRTLEIPRTLTPPKLEDFLTGDPPNQGVRVSDFRQREPGDGTPVSQKTWAYLSYDSENLYVVFICKDEPGEVRG